MQQVLCPFSSSRAQAAPFRMALRASEGQRCVGQCCVPGCMERSTAAHPAVSPYVSGGPAARSLMNIHWSVASNCVPLVGRSASVPLSADDIVRLKNNHKLREFEPSPKDLGSYYPIC